MMLFWLKHWKQISVAIAALMLFWAGYSVGADHVKNKWQAEKLAQSAAMDEARKKQDKALAKAEKRRAELETEIRGIYAKVEPNDCPISANSVRAINEAVRLAK